MEMKKYFFVSAFYFPYTACVLSSGASKLCASSSSNALVVFSLYIVQQNSRISFWQPCNDPLSLSPLIDLEATLSETDGELPTLQVNDTIINEETDLASSRLSEIEKRVAEVEKRKHRRRRTESGSTEASLLSPASGINRSRPSSPGHYQVNSPNSSLRDINNNSNNTNNYYTTPRIKSALTVSGPPSPAGKRLGQIGKPLLPMKRYYSTSCLASCTKAMDRSTTRLNRLYSSHANLAACKLLMLQ